MDFNEFNELINGKKEERKMNEKTLKELIENGEMEEFLRKLVDRKVDEFRKSYNEMDKMFYREYKDATEKGIYLVGFLEQISLQEQLQVIRSLTKGYVNELYDKGSLNLSYVDKFNIETMYNIVKNYGKDGFLEASLYSLLQDSEA